MTDAPLISIRGLSRAFGDVQAVNDVSFDVQAGEVVGLLGPNGAGKTTALRMLATLLEPDAGEIRVGGHDVRERPLDARRLMGYQTGETGVYGRLKPSEFLRYFGRLHGMNAARREARIAELLSEFGIDAFDDRLCEKLSTGQKQRVTLARTLLPEPPVIVLDEPTSGLDIVSAQFILSSLTHAAQRGHAVLFSTHIMSEVELICDRVIILIEGRVAMTGTVDQIREQTGEPSLMRAFLHLASPDDFASGEPDAPRDVRTLEQAEPLSDAVEVVQ